MPCTTRSHRLIHPTHKLTPRVARQQPDWPTYRGNDADLIGTSDRGVSVYLPPGLRGVESLACCNRLLRDADRVVIWNALTFASAEAPVHVLLLDLAGQTDGTGGADHMGCDYATGANIEVCLAYGLDKRTSALFEAELSECCMGGNLCGYSTGEALSRWCAALVSGNALSDFATAPAWDAAGRPNWVDSTDPTDQSAESTGCGMAFLSLLLQSVASIPKIAQTMVKLGEQGTLAQLYAALIGGAAGAAWPAFTAALASLPGPITSDDPFGAGGW